MAEQSDSATQRLNPRMLFPSIILGLLAGIAVIQSYVIDDFKLTIVAAIVLVAACSLPFTIKNTGGGA